MDKRSDKQNQIHRILPLARLSKKSIDPIQEMEKVHISPKKNNKLLNFDLFKMYVFLFNKMEY